ncbi:MAG: sulfite exporter TauE/SafE family protein [Myxococcota bacterium]
MDAALLLALSVAAFGTAALSATFGMAGGLLLMGVYTALLPVPEAMVLHGVTQLVSNGGRAWLLRGHVRGGGVRFYLLGAAAAWILLRSAAWVPDEATVFLGIGAIPFVALALPPSAALDFGRRRGATLCGALVAGAQLAFGVAGPLLDVFFVRTALLRREVVATKAVVSALSHALKVAFFAPILLVADPVSVDPLPGLALAAAVTVVGALGGTRVGGVMLERMGEDTFRRWTRRLVLAIGAVFLARGVVALG